MAATRQSLADILGGLAIARPAAPIVAKRQAGRWCSAGRPAAARLAALLTTAVLLLAEAALVLLPSPATADTTAMGGVAGDVYPIANSDIRMEAETVQAVCYRYFAEFRVDFKFVNSGEA
jgi:hypothetical protein